MLYFREACEYRFIYVVYGCLLKKKIIYEKFSDIHGLNAYRILDVMWRRRRK